MTSAIRLGYNNNGLLTCMEPAQAMDFVADPSKGLGLHYLEFGPPPESTYMMYGKDPFAFSRYFGQLAKCAEKAGLIVPVVSSWVRDNRDVASLDPDLHRAGVNVLKCLIDLGQIFGAERMMSPAGTIRGYTTSEERAARYRNLMSAWKEAAKYARGRVKSLEIEQMSWEDDPPQTIEQARQMLAEFDEERGRHPDQSVPIHLRYDIGHGPTPPPEGGDCPEYHPKNWFGAFPGRIHGAHLKGFDYTRSSARPLERVTRPDGPSSMEVVASLVKAIESVPSGEAPEYFDLVMEIGILKERKHILRVQLDGIRETAGVVKGCLADCGYRDDGSGTWAKRELRL
jgi:hypothetical protein